MVGLPEVNHPVRVALPRTTFIRLQRAWCSFAVSSSCLHQPAPMHHPAPDRHQTDTSQSPASHQPVTSQSTSQSPARTPARHQTVIVLPSGRRSGYDLLRRSLLQPCRLEGNIRGDFPALLVSASPYQSNRRLLPISTNHHRSPVIPTTL